MKASRTLSLIPRACNYVGVHSGFPVMEEGGHGGIKPTGGCSLAMDRQDVMAGSERSKNLPLAEKGCGGIELGDARGRDFPDHTRVTERKEKLPRPPLSHSKKCPGICSPPQRWESLWFRGSRDAGLSGLMALVHEGNSSERHRIRIWKNRKFKKRLLPRLHTWGELGDYQPSCLPPC
jgi:hypothetical protein